MPLLSDEARAAYEARLQEATKHVDILNADNLEAKVIGSLPPHLQAAWHSLSDSDPELSYRLGEHIEDAEHWAVLKVRRFVLETLIGDVCIGADPEP